MGALCRLRTRYPRRQAIHKALAYFREHRHRMRYADLRAQQLTHRLWCGGSRM